LKREPRASIILRENVKNDEEADEDEMLSHEREFSNFLSFFFLMRSSAKLLLRTMFMYDEGNWEEDEKNYFVSHL
jgi:hypothetical protein